MVKELLLTVLSAAVWGSHLGRKTVMFQCNNSSVVTSLQRVLPKILLAHTYSVACDSSQHITTLTWFVNTYQGPGLPLLTICQGITCNPFSPQMLRHPDNQPCYHMSYSHSQQYLALTGHLQPFMLHS